MSCNLLRVAANSSVKVGLKTAVVHDVATANRDRARARQVRREPFADDLTLCLKCLPLLVHLVDLLPVLMGNTEWPYSFRRSVKIFRGVECLPDKVGVLEVGLPENIAIGEECKGPVQPTVIRVLLAQDTRPGRVLPEISVLL